jgi:sugar phosphate isomerase/epimerase
VSVRLSAQEHLVPGETLEEKQALLEECGFAGIELHARDAAFADRLEELRRAQRNGAVLPTACHISDTFLGAFDEDRRRVAFDNLRSILETLGEIGGAGVVTPASFGMFSRALPPFTPPRPPEEDREILLDGVGRLAVHARGAGVAIYLEPLNRFEDHMLNRVEQAVDLARTLDDPFVRVLGDTFHMNIEEDDSGEALRSAGPYLGHLHLGDNTRAHPGTGQIDFGPIVAVLEESSYAGWAAMECGIRGDAPAAFRQVAALFAPG